jgi:hypothetical protein
LDEKIESNIIQLSYGENFIKNDRLNIWFVKKGYIPIVRLILDPSEPKTVALETEIKNDLNPDFVCSNISTTTGDLIGLRNFRTFNNSDVVSKNFNIAVQFKFEDPTLVNLTVSYAYSSFGAFQPYLKTQYGGNLYEQQNNITIIVRKIDQYPFESIRINFYSYLYFNNK